MVAVICRNKSYHFGLLNGFKYWYRRMHDCCIVNHLLCDADGASGGISNGTERQLMRAEKQFMRYMKNIQMNGPDRYYWSPIVMSKSSQGDCAAITIKYKFSPCSELSMEQLQNIMLILTLLVCLASLWKRHYYCSIVSCFMTVACRYDVCTPHESPI